MSTAQIRVNLAGLSNGSYVLLPGHTIEQFEALGIGDTAFTYSHERARSGYCWECDRPIWEGQPVEYDEDCYAFHEPCRWQRAARLEFEENLYKARYVVAVYECDREMGGPEEGGWSYETGSLVISVAVDDHDAANLIREGLSLEYPYTGQRGMYSKRGPDYTVTILDRHEGDEWLDERLNPIEHYPLHQPHYC